MRRRGRFQSILAGVTAALALFACDRSDDVVGCGALTLQGRGLQRDVVLVVTDTTRRDVLGAYGGQARTPAFDALARHGILFERAYAQAPWTKASMATLFTSLHPSQHRLTSHPLEPQQHPRSGGARAARATDVLAPGFVTLAELYAEAGYATAAFVSNPWMLEEFGFGQGFEHYDDSFARWDAPGALVSFAAVRWLEGVPAGRPVFLYLHFLDPHEPYGPLDRSETLAQAASLRADRRPLPVGAAEGIRRNARFADGESALDAGIPASLALLELAYARGVERFDQALGAFLKAHAELRDPDLTAFVVTSDHGESLYAHGIGGHGTSLFEDEVAVPLAMRLPGVEPIGARSNCPVGLVDLMPLLCAYSGLRCPTDLAGIDRLGEGAPPDPVPIVAEGVRGAQRHRAILDGRFKLIWEPDQPGLRDRSPYRFFDLAADPAEEHDLAEDEGVEELSEFVRLREALPDAVAPYEAPSGPSRELEPQVQERLRALGYTD